MRRALELAALARGRTSPNPMVGAVVVKDGIKVGEGYHHRAGTPHAEIHALRQAGTKAVGATLYVTLEPCCHYGRTPPCTEAVIDAGISKVVVAMTDPNPLVAGKGLARLRQAGIEVELVHGSLAEEAHRLNEAFVKYITTRHPFVTIKAAVSLDGRIATVTGDSQWITGQEARREVQRLRSFSDAVMVGIGTVLADDPLLTVRLEGDNKQPLRVIADSTLQIPLNSRLVQTAQEVPLVVAACAGRADPVRVEELDRRGVEVWLLPEYDGMVDLEQLLLDLGRRQVTSLLVEGGSRLNAGFWERGLVDKLIWFIAPLVIGGCKAPGAIGGEGARRLVDALRLDELSAVRVGADLMITAYPVRG